MIEIVKVSSKGQIVIPEDIRKELNIKEGTKLVLVERNGKLIMESEKNFTKDLELLNIEKEKIGWLLLAEKNLSKIWDNKKDDKTWKKYL